MFYCQKLVKLRQSHKIIIETQDRYVKEEFLMAFFACFERIYFECEINSQNGFRIHNRAQCKFYYTAEGVFLFLFSPCSSKIFVWLCLITSSRSSWIFHILFYYLCYMRSLSNVLSLLVVVPQKSPSSGFEHVCEILRKSLFKIKMSGIFWNEN